MESWDVQLCLPGWSDKHKAMHKHRTACDTVTWSSYVVFSVFFCFLLMAGLGWLCTQLPLKVVTGTHTTTKQFPYYNLLYLLNSSGQRSTQSTPWPWRQLNITSCPKKYGVSFFHTKYNCTLSGRYISVGVCRESGSYMGKAFSYLKHLRVEVPFQEDILIVCLNTMQQGVKGVGYRNQFSFFKVWISAAYKL